MRITSEGPTALLGAATVPVPARLGQGYQSWGQVVGCPGTDAIPAPPPAAVRQGIAYQTSGDPTSTSKDAPPSWRPSIYYQPHLAAPPDVSVYSDNQLPIPASPPVGKPYVAARRPTFLGQQQVGWPVTAPAYSWRA